jgi:hypothetical protein
MNEIKKKRRKEIRMKEVRKGTKIMEPDGPIYFRVHESYPNNILSFNFM